MILVVWDWQKRSKNRASLLAEFFCPAPFAPRMLPCSFLFIRVHLGNLIQSILSELYSSPSRKPLPYPSGQPGVAPSRTCHGARLWLFKTVCVSLWLGERRFSGVHSETRIHGGFAVKAITTCVGSLSNPERWFAGA
jgi:hypothetical protein